MAASSSGASRVEPCSGRAVILRAPSAWPLPPMAISSPAEGLMRPSDAGMRNWAPCSRSCRIPVRSSRWPGARMGTCSPVETPWARFGCGRGSRAGRLAACRRLRHIATGCAAWPLPPTAAFLPAPAGMAASSSGSGERQAAWARDRGSLVSGSEDGAVRLWDGERGEPLRVLQGYTAALYDLDWRPDGTAIASAGFDSVVSLWQVEGLGGGTPPELWRGHAWSVCGVGWRPDCGVLASAGWGNAIRL